VYGETFSTSNHPGGRRGSHMFTIENSLFVFGGNGLSSLTNPGWLGDLWEYKLARYTCFTLYDYDESVCSSHGRCNDTDNCLCASGYSSSDCSYWVRIQSIFNSINFIYRNVLTCLWRPRPLRGQRYLRVLRQQRPSIELFVV